jgi:hypothetical protein
VGRFHRFVWFGSDGQLRCVSGPFFFHKNGTEAAAGLAWHTDTRRLIISYSAGDDEAWIATVESDDVRRILDDVQRLPEGLVGEQRLARLQCEPQQISTPLNAELEMREAAE